MRNQAGKWGKEFRTAIASAIPRIAPEHDGQKHSASWCGTADSTASTIWAYPTAQEFE